VFHDALCMPARHFKEVISMLIKSCFDCKFHEIKELEMEQMSYCRRENCWSRYSKCVANKALDRFLKQESSRTDPP
jgi:hypothetical protein